MSRRLHALVTAAGIVTLALSLPSCRENTTTSPSTARELDSPALLGSTTGSANYLHTFGNAGTYPYHCQYHTTTAHRMAGTVVVDEQGLDSAFVTIFEGAYHPDRVTVRPNAQVRWQNFDDGTHHTVTSD